MSNYFRDEPGKASDTDPYGNWSQPKRSRGPVIAGILVSVFVIGGVGAFLWQDQPDKLPPREEESADDKFREAAAAFDSATLGTKDEELARIHKLFTELGHGFRAADGERLASHFDVDRLMQEAGRLGGLPKMSSGDYRSFVNGARIGMSRSLSENSQLYAYERFDLKRCTFDDQRGEALVYTRLWDSDGYGMKMRWWLKKGGDQWRVYDFEELTGGMRASNLMAAVVASVGTDDAKLLRLKSSIAKLQTVAMAVVAEDFDQMSESLDQITELDVAGLPKEIQAMVWAYRGLAHMANEANDDALDAFRRAEELHSDMPLVSYLRALTLTGLERYEEAEKQAREYIKQLGSDADGYWVLGDALYGQEKMDEAAGAYRSSLDDDSDYVDGLIGLSTALPDDAKAEVGQRFEKMRRPADHFVTVCEELIAWEDHNSLAAVIVAYRKTGTDDPELAFYDAWLKYQNEDFAEAAAIVQPAIEKVEDEENRQYFVDLYFDAMIGAGKAVEAYNNTEDAESALASIAPQLLDLEEIDQLTALVAAHRKRNPQSATADYYTGEIASHEEKWDEAVAAYRAAIAKSADPELSSDSRLSAVYAMFMSDRVLQAYREFQPKRDVFRQLAALLTVSAEDETGGEKLSNQLESLVKEHQQNDPSDPQLPLVSADLSWLKRDYAAVARLLDSPAVVDEIVEDWQRVDNLVRSLIHLKRFDRAFEIAKRDFDLSEDPWFPALVKVAQGDVDASEQWMEQFEDYGYLPDEYYDDDIFGPALRGPAFERLSDKYPDR